VTTKQLIKYFHIGMLASVQLDDKSVEEAARDWLAENEETWRTWLP